MRTALVAVGNSKGVRLPKPILEQAGIVDEVDLEVRDGEIVLRSARVPRAGWAEAFAAMSAAGDDDLLDRDLPTQWDASEWRW